MAISPMSVYYFFIALFLFLWIGFQIWINKSEHWWEEEERRGFLTIVANVATIVVLFVAIFTFVAYFYDLRGAEILSLKGLYYEAERNLNYMNYLDLNWERDLNKSNKLLGRFSTIALREASDSHWIKDANLLVSIRIIYTQLTLLNDELNRISMPLISERDLGIKRSVPQILEYKGSVIKGNLESLKSGLQEYARERNINYSQWDESLKNQYASLGTGTQFI